jgi:hypothetical protein
VESVFEFILEQLQLFYVRLGVEIKCDKKVHIIIPEVPIKVIGGY